MSLRPVSYRCLQQSSALHPHGEPDCPDRNYHSFFPRKFWQDSTRDPRADAESERVSGTLKNCMYKKRINMIDKQEGSEKEE